MFDPDICLCTGGNLEVCKNCKRYLYHLKDIEDEKKTGIGNYNSYFIEPPCKNGECSYEF